MPNLALSLTPFLDCFSKRKILYSLHLKEEIMGYCTHGFVLLSYLIKHLTTPQIYRLLSEIRILHEVTSDL